MRELLRSIVIVAVVCGWIQTELVRADEIPVISPVPSLLLRVDVPFTYDVEATGDPAPTFSLSMAPSGMTIDSTTGVITWTPTSKQTGWENVAVRATNSAGTAEQVLYLQVLSRDAELPVLELVPDQTFRANTGTWTYTLKATGTPTPRYSLSGAQVPLMQVNGVTGVVSWKPAPWNSGKYTVTVAASNFWGHDTQTFTITVLPALFTVQVSSTEGGSVTKPGEGTFQYEYGQYVDVEQTADEGYVFVKWSGTAIDSANFEAAMLPTQTICVADNCTVVANFRASSGATRTLTVSASDGGEVWKPGEGGFSCTDGTTVLLLAAHDPGWEFLKWTGSAVDAGKVANPMDGYTSVVMDGNYTLHANFVPHGSVPQYRFTILTTMGGETYPAMGQHLVYEGVELEVHALPMDGYRFSHWTGTAVDAGKLADPAYADNTLIMDADYTLTAHFEVGSAPRYTLTVSSGDGGHVLSPGEGGFQYDEGASIPIRALADSGYRFVGWSGSAVDAGKVANPAFDSTTVRMSADFTLVASFQPSAGPAMLMLSSTNGGEVSMPGEGVFSCLDGEDVAIDAQASAGYQFSRWTGTAVDAGKVANPASASTYVTMDGDHSLCANFAPTGQGSISVSVVTPNGGERLTPGSTIPVTWQTQGILTYLNIELSVDGGSTWTQILYHSGAGSSFDWAVPAADSERCLIRVSDPENPSVSDTSDAPFSIRTVASRIWYVDAAAAGRADGTSWADAFICLQDALSRALDGDSVLLAEGVYSPDLGEGWDVGDRTATFQLGNGVALYGGFPAGGGEWLRRNPAVHRSILSGDIGTLGVATDNSYHIVTAGKVTKTAVLDGCTVSDGYADGADPYDRGAGLYSLSGSPQIRNCTFVRNAAPAGYGGGACNTAGGATFINCVFTGNTAGNCGGGLYVERGAVTLINCTLTANQGLWRGGGVFTFGGTVTIANSILWGNGRQNGFRYDEGAQASGDLQPAMDHCCVQGWTGSIAGEGCSARDPLFVNAAGPDNVVGTLDDDLRLLPGSSCIDAGATAALPPGITTDLQGRSRTHDHSVDIGAYEFHGDD